MNLLLLLSGLLGIRLDSSDRRFSLVLVQTLVGLPLLASEYLYLAYHLNVRAVQLVLFSEFIFALLWLSMALRLRSVTTETLGKSRFHFSIEIMVGVMVTAVVGYLLVYRLLIEISDASIAFHIYSLVYFSAVFILLTVLNTAWRLELFWRALNAARRWEYKFLMVGSLLICGALAWASSYRLTYLAIIPRHLLLLAALLLFGWALMSYGVVNHRLLNRKIFISRKVIYSFVVPFILAAYLLVFGLITMAMRSFGLQLSYVLKWLLVALGFVAAGLFIFSGKMRRRVHFFISTHFYINKYEYRDEWLALSQHLQGALTEANVVEALREVLAESLYTTEIFIWLRESSQDYKIVSSPRNLDIRNNENAIAPNDPLVQYIKTHSHFHLKEKEPDAAWQKVVKDKEAFLNSQNLVLLAPISVGNQLAGLIGLGPEFTGGQYGHDDFDLLTALGSQTASALLAVRMAEELAHAREQQAWNRLSAFVLHDVKNAATMLSLLKENTPEHIQEPEFQRDLLETVDDALRRMGRVEQRLRTLKDEITPERQDFELGPFLQECGHRMETRLPSMEIAIEDTDGIQVSTDPELLAAILENLLLNAFEAGGEGTDVLIRTGRDDLDRKAVVEIIDNGPGIAPELLPDILFEPFKTTKDGGSGIGLWQVERVAACLGGSVSAENRLEGGARFTVKLPLREI
jgi:putative PEP-CTERM system histidine kinase